MRRRDVSAQRTGRRVADVFQSIMVAVRALWNFSGAVELDIGRQVVREVNGIAFHLVVLQGKLVGRGIHLAQVVDAGVAAAGGTRPDEIRHANNGSRQEQESQSEPNDSFSLGRSFS